MFKTNGTYVFDALGTEHFHTYFNYLINHYGSISVADLFEDPLLLGLDSPNLVRNLKDDEQFTKFTYHNVGWNRPILTTEMFKVQESKQGGIFEYVLNLPDYKEL